MLSSHIATYTSHMLADHSRGVRGNYPDEFRDIYNLGNRRCVFERRQMS
jgi:hypothetical protein